MPTEFQYDVFQNHNQADKPRVRRLAERLRAAGLKPKAEGRMQNAELLPSAFFILPSPLVGLERSTVGRGHLPFRDPANAGRRFIPLLLADCKLQGLKARKRIAQGKRGETSAALGHLPARFSSPERAKQVPALCRRGPFQIASFGFL